MKNLKMEDRYIREYETIYVDLGDNKTRSLVIPIYNIENLPSDFVLRPEILTQIAIINLIKENQQLKEKLEKERKVRKEAIEHIKELYDNTDDTTCYDIDKVEKERLLQILDIDKGE